MARCARLKLFDHHRFLESGFVVVSESHLIATGIKEWHVLCDWHMADRTPWTLPEYSHNTMDHARITLTLSTMKTSSPFFCVIRYQKKTEKKKRKKYAPTKSYQSKGLFRSGFKQGTPRSKDIYL